MRTRVALAIALAVGAALSTTAHGGRAKTIHPECVKPADHAHAVHFRTADHVGLAGVMLGSGAKGVTLAHQSRGDLCMWLPFARTLARAGYRVLPFDFRGYGESGSGKTTNYDADVAAAGRALRAAGARSVVYVGASLGGTASLAASALAPAPAGVISLSGPASFGYLDGVAAVRKTEVPLLLLAAKYDVAFAGDQKLVYDAARTRDKRVVIVAGGEHGVDLLTGPARARVRSLILAFLQAHPA
jgi:pimeloyl-ACP methyl ester carboxylesterase